MTPPNAREIVRSQRFRDSLRLILEIYPRAEEVITGLEWSLSRSPDTDGIHVGDGVWQCHLMKCRALPEALVHYAFTASQVVLVDINLVVDN